MNIAKLYRDSQEKNIVVWIVSPKKMHKESHKESSQLADSYLVPEAHRNFHDEVCMMGFF